MTEHHKREIVHPFPHLAHLRRENPDLSNTSSARSYLNGKSSCLSLLGSSAAETPVSNPTMITSKLLIPLCLSLTLGSSLSLRNSTCEEDLRLNIDLSGTGLQRLKAKFLSSSLINSLHLEDNQIWEISADAFTDLTNLQYLSLSRNLLPYRKLSLTFPKLKTLVLDEAFVEATPQSLQDLFTRGCRPCQSELLEFSKFLLLDLKITAELPELEKLHLRSNGIISLSGLQNTPKLMDLYLDNNIIADDLFEEFVPLGLRRLHLSGNSIDHFNSSVMGQLEELLLDHNKLCRLCSNNCTEGTRVSYHQEPILNLAGASRLEQLSVAHNMLMDIDPDAFADLESLQFLNLSGNYLKNIPPGVFQYLASLMILDISNNRLEEIPDVDDLPELEVLLLNGNHFKNVTLGSFTNLPKLKTLSLADNAISQFDAGSFDALMTLDELDLSANQLLRLPENWIAGIPLRRLHLNCNSFLGIDEMALTNARSIEYLGIAGNPLGNLSTKELVKLPETVVINIKGIGWSEGSDKCQSENLVGICGDQRLKNSEELESMEETK